jgi:hypothetical protein
MKNIYFCLYFPISDPIYMRETVRGNETVVIDDDDDDCAICCQPLFIRQHSTLNCEHICNTKGFITVC